MRGVLRDETGEAVWNQSVEALESLAIAHAAQSPWHTRFVHMPMSSYCKRLGFSAWRLYLAIGESMHIGWAEVLQASTNEGPKLVIKYHGFLAPWEGQAKHVLHTVSQSPPAVHTSNLLIYVTCIQFLPFPVLLTIPLEYFLESPPKQTKCTWSPCLRDNWGKSTTPRLFWIFEDECSAHSLH